MTATIWLRPLGQAWQPVGTGNERGVWHEGLECVSDQGGPLSARFTLLRSRRGLHGDLLARTPVIVEENCVRIWSGRTNDAPEQSGGARQIDVSCEGWQTHLDGDAYERPLVHTDLTAYKDVRSVLTADLTRHRAYPQVSNDNGVIVLTAPSGTPVANNDEVGVVLDLGPGGAAKRVVVTVDSSNNSAVTQLYVSGSDTPYWLDGAANRQDYVSAAVNNGFSSTTLAGSSSNPHRYVTIAMHQNGAFTPAADVWFRIKTAQVFADTAYESGNVSVLTADTIIKDALARATTLLSSDLSGIGAPVGFAFPNYAPDGPRTAREAIAAANAPHNWIFKIDEYQRPVFQARPTVPVVEFGAWPGNESDGGSSNSDEGVTTKAIVRGTGPDGTPLSATRTQTGTIVDRQGDVQVQILDSSFALTITLANQFGDTYLAAHRASPFKGTVVASKGGGRLVPGGMALHPAYLLLMTGQLARRTDLIDPDTGALGRNVTIDHVTYRADSLSSEVALDNTRHDFEALQARLGALVPA